MSGYFPRGGPDIYAYTSDFYNTYSGYEKSAGHALAAKSNTKYFGLANPGEHKLQILFNLQMLIDGAREAELAFLRDTGIDLTQGTTVKDIFLYFNDILNARDLLDRNINMFEQIAKKGSQNKMVDPSKYFYSYLSRAIYTEGRSLKINPSKLVGSQLEDFANHVIGIALEQAYRNFSEAVDKDGMIRTLGGKQTPNSDETILKAATEVANVIAKLRKAGMFKKYASVFKIDELVQQAASNSGTYIQRKPKLTSKSFDQGGTPLEVVSSVVGAEFAKMHYETHSDMLSLNITGEQTGGGAFNNQKGDTMIAYSKTTVDFSKMAEIFEKHKGDSNSVRIQNINALKEYLDTLGENIDHLLVISDKNYSIKMNVNGSYWRGAHAQERMDLKSAQDMLSQFGVPQVKELINYLANCGTGMIQGKENAYIRVVLATYIAYFLFDHVEITGQVSGTNVVNIINLSGTYIPLSVYLQGVYESLEKNLRNPNTMVRVTISLNGEEPEKGQWTPEIWQDYREGRESNSSIEYYIMKDIASFITNLMSS